LATNFFASAKKAPLFAERQKRAACCQPPADNPGIRILFFHKMRIRCAWCNEHPHFFHLSEKKVGAFCSSKMAAALYFHKVRIHRPEDDVHPQIFFKNLGQHFPSGKCTPHLLFPRQGA